MSVIALTYMVAEMEKKLRDLMGDKEYRKFAAKVAKGDFYGRNLRHEGKRV